jgi:hypothetical protein
MYINTEILIFVISGLSVFFWWFFRKNIQESKDARAELLSVIKELRISIDKLTESQTETNVKLLKLQTQHDMVFRTGAMVASHHFTESE